LTIKGFAVVEFENISSPLLGFFNVGCLFYPRPIAAPVFKRGGFTALGIYERP
jgi:hypothetical protein